MITSSSTAANGGSNDLCNNPSTKMKTELGKQPTGDEGADNSNNNIAKANQSLSLARFGRPASPQQRQSTI